MHRVLMTLGGWRLLSCVQQAWIQVLLGRPRTVNTLRTDLGQETVWSYWVDTDHLALLWFVNDRFVNAVATARWELAGILTQDHAQRHRTACPVACYAPRRCRV